MTALSAQILAVVVASSGLLPTTARPPSPAPDCTIQGTPGNDYLRGTPGDDVICGLGGNDVLLGLGGNDVLIGGPGRDILLGGPGSDELYGDAGDDQLIDTDGIGFENGGDGTDHCVGVGGTEFVHCERVITIPNYEREPTAKAARATWTWISPG
jgi:Ca2+-binding RTX toxin-like protein